MKLSARNVIKGTINEIERGAVSAVVKVDIGGGNVMSATITVDALDDMQLKVGDEAYCVIKASNVMLMQE